MSSMSASYEPHGLSAMLPCRNADCSQKDMAKAQFSYTDLGLPMQNGWEKLQGFVVLVMDFMLMQLTLAGLSTEEYNKCCSDGLV